VTNVRDSRLESLLSSTPNQAWSAVFEKLWEIFSSPLNIDQAENEVHQRERQVGDIELLLSSSAWDLWYDFESCVPRTAACLIDFWGQSTNAKAVLILDGLSLREAPWILQEATRRGYNIHRGLVCGSEIPSDTTTFAKALGFGQRSSLENNGASATHRLNGARTESLGAAWDYCLDWLASAPSIVLWHHWPDERIHQLAKPGDGFQQLCREAAQHLTSDSFWKVVEHMATGRRLVITSDHGYAASGMFADVINRDQQQWLKKTFGGSRFAAACSSEDHWSPPISLCLQTKTGTHQFALGRRKWSSSSGYPTLAHGGLSLLEVAVPFIELSKA
jgi:hypothetical protein